MGFEINSYAIFIAKIIIDGIQCILVWYEDENKSSHQYPEVVTEILEALKKKIGELVINRGNTHTFLGMHFNTREDKIIDIDRRINLKSQ